MIQIIACLAPETEADTDTVRALQNALLVASSRELAMPIANLHIMTARAVNPWNYSAPIAILVLVEPERLFSRTVAAELIRDAAESLLTDHCGKAMDVEVHIIAADIESTQSSKSLETA